MGRNQEADFVVLGGGLAGLTFALEVARKGKQVVVLEQDSQVGGLARTVAHGGFRYDLGGHRFHSAWPSVSTWVSDLMGEDLLEVVRRSRIHLGGRYVEYPLRLAGALRIFSPVKAGEVLLSYLGASLRSNGRDHDVSFEDWVVRRFGRALYDIYFRPYTEKVWGIPCTELSADWASARIQVPGLVTAISESLLRITARPTLLSRFLYPRHGIGMIPERAAEQAVATGRAQVHLNSRVVRLERHEWEPAWEVGFLKAGVEQVVGGRQVVSTIPLDRLLETLPDDGHPLPSGRKTLAYRSLICVFLAVDGPRISRDTWTYFPDEDLLLGRTHEPANWSPEMVPEGKTSLCVEIFCDAGDSNWQRSDAELVEAVIAELTGLRFLQPDRVCDAWVLRAPTAYPIYRIGYGQALRQVLDYLARWPGLTVAGRTGSFRYLNMDAVIRQSLCLAQTLTGAA